MKTCKNKLLEYKGKDLAPGEDKIKIRRKRKSTIAKKSVKIACKKVAKKVK